MSEGNQKNISQMLVRREDLRRELSDIEQQLRTAIDIPIEWTVTKSPIADGVALLGKSRHNNEDIILVVHGSREYQDFYMIDGDGARHPSVNARAVQSVLRLFNEKEKAND